MIDAILYDIAFKVSYGTVKSKVKHADRYEKILDGLDEALKTKESE